MFTETIINKRVFYPKTFQAGLERIIIKKFLGIPYGYDSEYFACDHKISLLFIMHTSKIMKNTLKHVMFERHEINQLKQIKYKKMNKIEIQEKLYNIANSINGCNREEFFIPDAKLIDDIGFDSLNVVEMIIAIEEDFAIDVNDNISAKWTTITEVIDYIEKAI